jgi:hypothetical protein
MMLVDAGKRGLPLSNLWMIISLVLGVFAASALFGWIMFRVAKSMDRSNSDPRYRRRIFILLAAVYVVSMTVGVSEDSWKSTLAIADRFADSPPLGLCVVERSESD